MGSDDAVECHSRESKINKRRNVSKSWKKAKEHMKQLQRLQEKDPEFYKYLEEHGKELLEFNDEEIEDGINSSDQNIADDVDGNDSNSVRVSSTADVEYRPSVNVLSSATVDSWCSSIRSGKLSVVRSMLRAFRMACHCGDDGNDSIKQIGCMSSSVFNKVMLLVLNEMDGVLRELLKFPPDAKKTITELMGTSRWKKYNHLVKSYLGNALHVLNQMTDSEMVSFTLRRLRCSSILLSGIPSLMRKYIKVLLHFWGIGEGALPVVSLLFLRDLCTQTGSKCMDECFKGIYRAYIMNCQFVNAVKLQHIQFLGNCVIELLAVDLQCAYQHTFVFIRQLAIILREAMNAKTKEAFRKVYEWKFINCLELWTSTVCTYATQADLQLLIYPLSQVIIGMARLVPTARYFPLRLRCIRMLNRISASTGSFIPVSMLLLEMLDMKELKKPPTGGAGKAVDLRVMLKVTKPTLKTRAFQDACVSAVIEELAEHLAQWSYCVAFAELSFIPVVRLRSFCKTTKVERFRRQIKELLCQVDADSKRTIAKRGSYTFLSSDPSAMSFIEDLKKSGASSLSQFVASLRERAEQRSKSLVESCVVVGAESSVFQKKVLDAEDGARNEDGSAVFSSSWLPKATARPEENSGDKKRKKRKVHNRSVEDGAINEDVVEDLVLSSDEDELSLASDDEPQQSKQQLSSLSLKRGGKFKKRKRGSR